jgi:hypothetical protein
MGIGKPRDVAATKQAHRLKYSPQPCWLNPKGASPETVPVKRPDAMNGLLLLDS